MTVAAGGKAAALVLSSGAQCDDAAVAVAVVKMTATKKQDRH